MNKIKLLKLGMVLMMSGIYIGISGCTKNKYDAVLYSYVNDWIDEDFLMDNRVKAYYPNENYVEGDSFPWEKFIYDEQSPTIRTFIITNEIEFKNIFSKREITINFNTEMVILYVFADVYPNRNYELEKIELNDGVLIIKTELGEKSDVDDASSPFQRCFMIKMKKMKIKEVIFK